MKLIRKFKKAINLLHKGEFSSFFRRINANIVNTYLALKRLNPNNVILRTLEIIITEKCTLKCKNCANLMQYYLHPRHIDIKQVIHDLDLFMEQVDYIYGINLIGGETLMVKQIAEIILHVRKYKGKYSFLNIITNGTVIPSEQTLLAIKKANIHVRISDYEEKSTKRDMLIAELKKHKIKYSVNKVIWKYLQQVVDIRDRTADEVNEIFQECNANCTSVLNGKLYRCPFLAHGDNLRLFPADKRNYIDLTDESITKKDIVQYLSKSTPPPRVLVL